VNVLAYVIARRRRIAERQLEADKQKQAASRSYGKDRAVTSRRTPAVDVAKLAELHERGLLTDEEYVRQRMRALS
jgi:Short C-terminal domain